MRLSSLLLSVAACAAQVLASPAAFAQTPAPARAWTETASAGLALTAGNADTSTINIGYDIKFDPHAVDPAAKNVVKSTGLFLRGKNNGELTADRLGLDGRDEYALGDRAFVFGQLQYLRDHFKQIDYLLAPTGGVGYKVIATPSTSLSASAGAGGVWEKNPGLDVSSSGAIVFDDALSYKLSATAAFTQSFSALFKTSDFGDALYVTGAAIAATVNTKIQLKFEVLDTYKHKPPVAGVLKNDVAVIVALVYKT